jgi:type IV pilus assembly protein PilN
MPRINLLPWRDEQRKRRKLEFGVALGAAAIAAMFAAGGVYVFYGSLISGQEARNVKLRGEITELDRQIEKIDNLESQKQKFIARMQIIEKLQRSRPEVVHLFDEVARTIPEGAYLTGIKQTNNKLKFEGVAQSSTRVSSFMRNIDASLWLRNPELEVIETKAGQALGANFTLSAEQRTVAGADEEGVPKKKKTLRAVQGAEGQ